MTEQAASNSQKVVIVGGGMTGGLLALMLADQGMAVTVLDGAPLPAYPEGDPQMRVSTLTEASHWLLRNTGVWERLQPERVQPYAAMRVWDRDGTGEVNFDSEDAGAASLGWLLENGHLSAALYAAALDRPNLAWRGEARVADIRRQESGWRVITADDELHADLLVGADGARSLVRDLVGIAGNPTDSGHHALVATIASEHAHGACARQVFMDSGPLALLPLFGDGHQCSIVWSGWPDRIAALRDQDSDHFNRELTAASGEVLGELAVCSQRVVFPIQERHASSYCGPGVALVGDAAHVIHPLAGQGVNLGLLDAAVLAEEVGRMVAAGRACADPVALARYERRRRGENLLMQNAMRGFKHLFERPELPVRWLRNTGLRMVDSLAPMRGFFVRQALGRGGDLPRLARPVRHS